MSALGAGVIGGALGGGIAVTVLAPLTAANNFLGSYFFGSGMILGERQMYQDDWIKIKKRLDAGESFLIILEEVMKPNTQAVMQMARETVIAVSAEWNKIVLDYIESIPDSIWNALKILAGGSPDELPGVNKSGLTYDDWLAGKSPPSTTTDTTTTTLETTPSPNPTKTKQQIDEEKQKVLNEINKIHQGKMKEYTTFFAKLSAANQLLAKHRASFFAAKTSPDRVKFAKLSNTAVQTQGAIKLAFANWKKNNRAWLTNNGLS